ncbi:BolA family protein [Sneathiella limimaris]|uniref:BolA family protein n=1 Tax=Sneathiella limimaris TaxID=1964213 RepID=UPI00146F509F|nr:BolA family protein [Sneathiella limimaris]
MKATDKISDKLIKDFSPITLEVKDESYLHAGHAGAPKGGESHFHVKMVSAIFEGQSRVQRQKMVHQSLKEDLATYIHALSLELKTPSEAE